MNDRELQDVTRARIEAQNAANSLHNAAAWIGPIDPEEEGRDPKEMLKMNLLGAEAGLVRSLELVRRTVAAI